jgi:hypothetical protein
MAALANLAKFEGRYDQWLEIRRRYNLKWSSGSSSNQVLERFFNEGLTLDVMLSRVKRMIEALPAHLGAVVKFACLTGLRPSEAVESVNLVSNKESFARYYNQERQALEHFRFPEIFLRRTKNAYISFVTLDNLQPILNLGGKTLTWNAIRMGCLHRSIPMDMRFCRKIFASHLSACGIQSEFIDLLSGRVPPTVLGRHYLTPSHDLREKILQAVSQLSVKL